MKTKNRIWFCPLIVVGLVLILTNSCKKDEEPADKITDKDGNIYTSVTIGTQVWLVEDLKTTKYLNGDPIPSNLNDNDWYNATSDAVKIHTNSIYGNLYNGLAVNDSRKLCPTGWHIPLNTEWETLITYLGGGDIAGGKMKEAGTAHWNSPNTGATNESGFTALPTGLFQGGSTIEAVGEYSSRWSATQNGNEGNYDFPLSYNGAYCYRSQHLKRIGYPVRCLKD
jgi:uncharacterized protein (TIGR02145 family)